jgi:hypothetical protein
MLLLLLSTALAVDPTDVTTYNGTYDLWCESAQLSLDLSLAVGVGGSAGSWSTSSAASLPCSPSRASILRAARGMADSCAAAGLDPLDCEDLGRELFQQLLPLRDLGTLLMPTGMRWTITNASDPWAQALQLFDVAATHRWDDGRIAYWNYLLDPRPPQGAHFAALGLAASPIQGSSGFGCTGLATAAVDGYVLGDATVAADWALDQRLICAGFGTSGEWLAITVGLNVIGEMGGEKR